MEWLGKHPSPTLLCYVRLWGSASDHVCDSCNDPTSAPVQQGLNFYLQLCLFHSSAFVSLLRVNDLPGNVIPALKRCRAFSEQSKLRKKGRNTSAGIQPWQKDDLHYAHVEKAGGSCVYLSSFEWGRPTVLVLEICRPANPITQLSDAKSPLMALHVPELRMMMLANESSADIPYWNQWPLRTE